MRRLNPWMFLRRRLRRVEQRRLLVLAARYQRIWRSWWVVGGEAIRGGAFLSVGHPLK